jgi:3-oxoacid CoA-transferase subunit B
VAMEHATRDGQPKILKQCALPLTGTRCVHYIVTDLAFLEVTPGGLLLREVARGTTAEQVQRLTEPKLQVSPELREMAL